MADERWVIMPGWMLCQSADTKATWVESFAIFDGDHCVAYGAREDEAKLRFIVSCANKFEMPR